MGKLKILQRKIFSEIYLTRIQTEYRGQNNIPIENRFSFEHRKLY